VENNNIDEKIVSTDPDSNNHTNIEEKLIKNKSNNSNVNEEILEEDEDDKDSIFEEFSREGEAHFLLDFFKLFKEGVRNF
jgi:hypothetical protein